MNAHEYRRRVEEVMRYRCPRRVAIKKRQTETHEPKDPLGLPTITVKVIPGFSNEPWEFIKARETEAAVELAFVVPCGYSAHDLKQETDSLFAACGAFISIVDRAGVVVVNISRKDFPDAILFHSDMLNLSKGREVLCGFDIMGNPLTHNFRVPHVLIGAQSGYGKTDLLRFWIYQLITRFTPDQLWIDIIDGKGFSFLPFRGIPHIRRIGRDLSSALSIMTDGKKIMNERSNQVWETADRSLTSSFQWRLIIVDEMYVISPYSQVSKEDKELANQTYAAMASISCVGREASVGVVMATQRPDVNVVHPQVKQNCDVSIALKCKTETNSEIILDRGGAEKLPHNKPGRAIYSAKEDVIFQIPFVGNDEVWDSLLAPYKKEVIRNEPAKIGNDLSAFLM